MIKDYEKFFGIARETFSEALSNFSQLKTTENDDENIDICITIPIQQGLKYEVTLCLQEHDELHLYISNLWFRWFPIHMQERRDDFIKTVNDFLSGQGRIVEHYRGNHCFKSEMQMPEGDEWKTVGISPQEISIPWPWRKVTQKILQNS